MYYANYIDFTHVGLNTALVFLFAGLIFGSYTDFKWHEVPDWINYGLIFVGFGIHLLYSVIYNDWMYSFEAVIGFFVFLGIAYLLFYSGQWGGGDSKMLIAIGTLLGIKFTISYFSLSIVFFINSLFVGALYGILWSIGLALFKWKQFAIAFKKKWYERRRMRLILNIIAIILIVCALVFPMSLLFWKILLSIFGVMLIIFYFVWIFMKSIETSAMYKNLDPSKLVEGDWIVKDIYNGKKVVASSKDLGLEREQIEKILQMKKENKIKYVLVKEGIPYIPSFLIALIVTLVFGNLINYFIH